MTKGYPVLRTMGKEKPSSPYIRSVCCVLHGSGALKSVGSRLQTGAEKYVGGRGLYIQCFIYTNTNLLDVVP